MAGLYNPLMAGFADSLDALWTVQKHDAAIVREQKRIAQAEREVAMEQRKQETAVAARDAVQGKLRELKTRHKELEQELQGMDARARQLEAQGTEAGTKAAARQREKVDALENDGLELLIQISTQDVELAKAEAEAEAARAHASHSAEIAAAAIQAAQAVIDATAEVRRLAAQPIAPELLQVYDEANARHPGQALCRIDGEFCGGCQANLNTQLLMQVRARREILRCPQCLRILDAAAS